MALLEKLTDILSLSRLEGIFDIIAGGFDVLELPALKSIGESLKIHVLLELPSLLLCHHLIRVAKSA